MQIKLCMIYREVIAKRLERKRQQLAEIESKMNGVESMPTTVDKRKYIELKAVVLELENCIDIADSMFKFNKEDEKE